MPKPQAKRINLRKIKLLFPHLLKFIAAQGRLRPKSSKNKPKEFVPQKQPNFTSNFASRTPFFRPCYCIRYFAYQSRLCRSCRSWRSISPQWLARPPTRSSRLDLRNRRRPRYHRLFVRNLAPFARPRRCPRARGASRPNLSRRTSLRQRISSLFMSLPNTKNDLNL